MKIVDKQAVDTLTRLEQGGEAGIHVRELEVVARDIVTTLIDMRIERGTCVALIGHNGSGKTTIIEAILGIRTPKRLAGAMLGIDFAQWRRKPALRRRLGVLLQNAALPAELFVSDVVTLHRELYGRAAPWILDALGIAALSQKRYKSLSRGERQRVDLMLALAHEPDVAFLDEPYTGLDKQFAEASGEVLARLAGKSTIVMACHSAEELALSDKVAWMQRGKLRMWAGAEYLRQNLLGDFRLAVTFHDEESAVHFRERVMAEAAPQFTKSDNPLQLSVFGSEALVNLARGLVDDSRLDGLEFGRTSYNDLLYRCALGDIDA